MKLSTLLIRVGYPLEKVVFACFFNGLFWRTLVLATLWSIVSNVAQAAVTKENNVRVTQTQKQSVSKTNETTIIEENFGYRSDLTTLDGAKPKDGNGVGDSFWTVVAQNGAQGSAGISTQKGQAVIVTNGNAAPLNNATGGSAEARYNEITFEPNRIYTLTVVIQFTEPLACDSWIGFGFGVVVNGQSDQAWMLIRPQSTESEGNTLNGFVGSKVLGSSLPSFAYSEPITAVITLNTATNEVEMFVNGVSIGSGQRASSDLSSIFFCGSATGKVGRVNSVTLVSRPS